MSLIAMDWQSATNKVPKRRCSLPGNSLELVKNLVAYIQTKNINPVENKKCLPRRRGSLDSHIVLNQLGGYQLKNQSPPPSKRNSLLADTYCKIRAKKLREFYNEKSKKLVAHTVKQTDQLSSKVVKLKKHTRTKTVQLQPDLLEKVDAFDIGNSWPFDDKYLQFIKPRSDTPLTNIVLSSLKFRLEKEPGSFTTE